MVHTSSMKKLKPLLVVILVVATFSIPVLAQNQRTRQTPSPATQTNCSPSYPDVCIAPPPPDLDCKDISYRNFKVVQPDPHKFDGDKDGIGCEQR